MSETGLRSGVLPGAAPIQHPGDVIIERLEQDDSSDFDFFLCRGKALPATIEQFVESRATPINQFLYEAT